MEDYKEKYEKLHRFVNDLYPHMSDYCKEKVEGYFPELKESEDDRIKTNIIQLLIFVCYANHQYSDECNEAIAWLEKQGHDGKKWIYEDVYIKEKEQLFQDGIDEVLENPQKYGLEKQGEQKFVNKVEPKFKVGDWIISSEGTLRHIVAVDKTGYKTDKGWLTHDNYEKSFHLWKIQDAKDGDVIYYKSPSGIEYIVMSSGVNRFGNVDSYFRYNSVDGFGISVPSVLSTKVDNITPATEEQRDFLFKKMKEAGYEWDADKKELKKIEQKPEFCHHEVDLSNCSEEYRKAYYDGWNNCNQQHSQLKAEQKSTWSEDDERYYDSALWHIKNSCGKVGAVYNWLKVLKERYSWKPSDEQIGVIAKIINSNTLDAYTLGILQHFYQDLIKMKEE